MASSPSYAAKHRTLDLSHVELDSPDYATIRQQRMDRNRRTMEAADKGITRTILPEADQISAEVRAAVQIQRIYRGHQGRQEYTDRLFARFQQVRVAEKLD
ncbi:hypothetical protein RRG08_059517 [Elysia crispata]|uniref:Uncharacterized protein n=1 Tax=Elysia crispata TaxID=231223 RepID=A0AAE0YPV8_9GAST|nr:hypothetical protein RRG08_059517 [Elysia crispata]